MYIFRQRPVVV